MRKIKFRIYNGSEMKYPTNIQEYSNIELHTGYAKDYTKDGVFIRPNLKKCVLMLFTGLIDKNGKEIYEGDILTKWDGLKKKVFFSDKYYNFQLSHLDNKGFCDTLAFWNQESTEVIGNIYENPELLSTPTAVL